MPLRRVLACRGPYIRLTGGTNSTFLATVSTSFSLFAAVSCCCVIKAAKLVCCADVQLGVVCLRKFLVFVQNAQLPVAFDCSWGQRAARNIIMLSVSARTYIQCCLYMQQQLASADAPATAGTPAKPGKDSQFLPEAEAVPLLL